MPSYIEPQNPFEPQNFELKDIILGDNVLKTEKSFVITGQLNSDRKNEPSNAADDQVEGESQVKVENDSAVDQVEGESKVKVKSYSAVDFEDNVSDDVSETGIESDVKQEKNSMEEFDLQEVILNDSVLTKDTSFFLNF